MLTFFKTLFKKENAILLNSAETSPSDEENILEYYKNDYESVYVILHPFIKSKACNLKQFDPSGQKHLIVKREDIDDINEFLNNARPLIWPSYTEIISNCSPIKWEQILSISNFKNINEIDIALLTEVLVSSVKLENRKLAVVLTLPEEFENKKLNDELTQICKKHGFICPTEGEISPFIQNTLFTAIKELGFENMIITNQFGDDRSERSIKDIISKDLIPSCGNIFDENHDILITTPWEREDYFSLLCSSKNNIKKILEITDLEGFYCDETTKISWSIS